MTPKSDGFRILEIKKSVFEGNDQRAAVLRQELKDQNTFLINLMSSPGSGKTTTLVRTIQALGNAHRIGILEADIDSDVDARTIAATGARVIQLHTGGMCHVDAEMTRQGLEGLGTQDLDLVVLENIGNLICTADFDTGAAKNAVILSVPEGDDKPLKYPHMFEVADILLVNKIDVLPYFDFSMDKLQERVKKLNPDITIFPLSAKTGYGIGLWVEWLKSQMESWQT